MSLKVWSEEVRETNRKNGWNVIEPEQWEDPHKVPAILALIHSEASEALEAFRKDDKKNFEEELADIVIRVMDCARGLQIDLDSAILSKMEKNKHRGWRHGGKKV
jgi:NTP pyrophosphatase (non-canonical NTP hydrolase)